MPRSSDEMETRTGRRTPNPNGSSVHDTQPRRSSRFKLAVKNNESSPESPQSDSNTVNSRVTRKRAGTMDSSVVLESVRTLRPRKTSTSPTISEVADTESTGTPSRRTRRSLATVPSAETPKVVARTRRLTRAGSEAKSPPRTPRSTRRTRASSMGPETIMEIKEETNKIVKADQEHTLPEIIEINEESKTSGEKEIDEDKKIHSRKSEGTKEQAIKGQQEFIENVASAQNQNAKNDIIPSTKESVVLNQPKVILTKEISISNTETQHVVSVDEESSQDGSKDFELQIENTSHESTEEQHSDMSNKENETTHTIGNMEQNADNVKTGITLQSPKPLRSVVTNKLEKEKPASPLRESVKNSEYLKEAAQASLDVSVTDGNIARKMEDVKSSVNETVVSDEVSENQERPLKDEVTNSPLLTHNQSNEATPVKSSDLSLNISEEKLGENSIDSQNVEDKTEREEAEKEIIDGIEITDITDIETAQTENSDVETTGIVDDSETTTVDGTKEETVDEPMDVSILEFRETITENSTDENEILTEHIAEDKSIETCNSDTKSEPTDNLQTPSKLNPTDLQSENKSSKSEILENTDAVNSKSAAAIEIRDEKCQDDTVVNRDESNLVDAEKIESSAVPEPEMECTVERSEKEEIPIESLPRNSPSAASKSAKPDGLTEKLDKEKTENTKNIVTSEIDSDANTECLFQDIPATEWKKKKKHSDNESISSLTTEKHENESEAECDLVLVDREAWLAAESYKAAKEKDISDYDSDDTVVLKSRIDFAKDRLNRSAKLQTLVEESDDDENVSKSVRRKSLSNRRKSVTKSVEKKLNIDASPQVKENDISNDSPQRPASRQFLSKSLIMQETQENHDSSIKNVNLNKSESLGMSSMKKRRTLNKSVHNISLQDVPDNKNEEDSEIDTGTKVSSEIKKKCMSESQTNDNSDDDLLESIDESKKKRKDRRSLSKSSKNKANLDECSTKSCDESNESSEEEETHEIPSSLTKTDNKKKVVKKNVLTVVRVDSDSNETSAASDSDETINQSSRLPRFLFAGADSNTDDTSGEGSIDSDVKREYNLDGKDLSKFDDDDVPGDECRASESEYSDSSDNGSDLADFVVDDDEVEDDDDDDVDDEADDQGKEDVNVDVDENKDEIPDEETNVDVDTNEEEITEDLAELIEQIQNAGSTEDELEKDHNSDSHEEEEPKANESEDSDEGNGINVQEYEDEIELEPVQSSEVQKSKFEKSIDSPSSNAIRSGKKKQESQTSICIQAESEEVEVANISKKEKRKKANKNKKNAELDTFGEQYLDELCIRTISVNKSLECSTPKHSVAKQERFHTSLDTSNITLQSQKKANKISAANLLSSVFSKTDTNDIPLKTETPLRKLQKTKKMEKLLHKSLPSELMDLPKETNLSRVTSSNVSQLHKAVATPNPTQNECRSKENLNVSNETIKINKKSKVAKIITDDESNESVNELEDLAVSDKAIPNVTNKKPQILAKAEALQKLQSESNNNQAKKMKKRKRDRKQAATEIHLADEKDESPIVNPKRMRRVQVIPDQDSEEIVENVSKTKKKKKMSSKVEADVVMDQVSNKIIISPSTEENKQVLDKSKKKNKKEKTKIISPDVESFSSSITQSKKNKSAKTVSSESIDSVEEPQKKPKLKEVSSKHEIPKKSQILNSADSDNEPETISISKAREDAVQAAKLAAESLRVNKQVKQQRRDKHFEKTNSEKETKMPKNQRKSETTKSDQLELPKKGIKRLADEILENLSDVPKAQSKKRRISKKELQILPSKAISNSGFVESKIAAAEMFIPLSSRGSTTEFSVINLQKLKRQAKKSTAITSFRQKMLNRNPRQPISAYMMYIEKQKTSRNMQE